MKLIERANAGVHCHIEERIRLLGTDYATPFLDLGAGTDAFLARLNAAGFTSLTGIDIVVPPDAVEGVSFHAYDLDSGVMPFGDGVFKLIVCVEVFEHIENMGALLKEVARVMAPNGSLLTTPNVHSMEARPRYLLTARLKQFDDLSDRTHIYPIHLFPFERLLRRYGLEVAQRWRFPVDGSSPTSRHGLRLAARVLKLLGLRSSVAGDHLCLLVRRSQGDADQARRGKADVVAAHYTSDVVPNVTQQLSNRCRRRIGGSSTTSASAASKPGWKQSTPDRAGPLRSVPPRGHLSQRLTSLLRTLSGVRAMVGWSWTLALRPIQPLVDGWLTPLLCWPWFSICVEAYKARLSER